MSSFKFTPHILHSLVVLGAEYVKNTEAKAAILSTAKPEVPIYTVTGYSPAAQEVHITKRGQRDPLILPRAQFQKEYSLHRP